MALGRETVDVLVFARTPLTEKTKVARSGKQLRIFCGDSLLGHTINTLGHHLSPGQSKSTASEEREIEIHPLGISARVAITRPFTTGFTIIDTLVPLGVGQRELIIGDRKTGKTQFLLRTMLHQAKLGTVVIYCAIGKRKQEIKSVEEFLQAHQVFDRCIIVAADSHSNPGEIVFAPYTALTLAEYFRDLGQDVLVVLDDLTTHAKYYREVALLLGTFPGRESYPGDIFFVHSKLLERAGCFLVSGKERAITCLPVVESLSGDFTGYIQTNAMSITDGHIYFDTELFAQGKRPAVNTFLSVTRVGRQTQSPLQRDLNSSTVQLLAQYEELQRFLRFGSELSEEIHQTLQRGDSVLRLFHQTGLQPIPTFVQAFFLSAVWLKWWDGSGTATVLSTLAPTVLKDIQDLVAEVTTFTDLQVRVKKHQVSFKPLFATAP
jgi:F-type H+-transporting ATPase subunit alpha